VNNDENGQVQTHPNLRDDNPLQIIMHVHHANVSKAFHAKTPLESKNPEKVQENAEMDGEAIQEKTSTW